LAEIPNDRMVHQTSVKVRFYELDPYDHVNHTNYFSYFETARIELLAERGWGLDLMKQRGFQLVVVEAHARFLAAARYGEELEIFTWVESVGRVKSTWRQTMLRAGDEIARLRIDAAFTDLTGKPRRIPPEFAESMGALTES
jgi:acyl-CoA thioester hydrolase